MEHCIYNKHWNAQEEKQEEEEERSPPVPMDLSIKSHLRAVIITGPNTGGKTASLKVLAVDCPVMDAITSHIITDPPDYLYYAAMIHLWNPSPPEGCHLYRPQHRRQNGQSEGLVDLHDALQSIMGVHCCPPAEAHAKRRANGPRSWLMMACQMMVIVKRLVQHRTALSLAARLTEYGWPQDTHASPQCHGCPPAS